jgi:hypothetical protein
VKRIIKILVKQWMYLEREGKKHTVVYNPSTNLSSTIPRHREINTFTGKNICRDLGIAEIKIK